MEALKTKFTSLTVSNLTLIVICALAIYLFRVRQTYGLTPQWRKDLDAEMYHNGKFPGPEEVVLPPVVTDLESDGTNEIVLLTNNLNLEVLVVPPEGGTKKLPQPESVHAVQLPIVRDEDGRPSRPVAMATGYLTEFQSVAQVRKQVITIVLDSWDVLCYNHELELLWQQKLMDVGQMREDYQVKSIGILVSSHSITKTEQGTIIVGGSFGPKGHVAREVPQEKMSKKMQMHQMGSSFQDAAAEDPYTHFSTFALGGSNGTVQWHHLPGDFHSKPKKSMKEHYHWKLGLKAGSWHQGQMHWTKFGGSVLEYLPHQWSTLQDTTLDLAQLKKSETPSNPKDQETSTRLADLIGLDAEHLVGYAYGGLPPHSPQEHIKHPNALVVHNHEGLEVLDLGSGQPLTQLSMPDIKSAYVDMDSDKASVEIVRADYGVNCRAEVSTVFPRTKAMFVGPLCESPTVWGEGLFSGVFSFAPANVNEDTHLAVPPLVLERVAPRKGILTHLMGEGFHSSKQGYDSIYLTSTGRMTSYGHAGNFNWQVLVPALWSEQTRRADNMGDLYESSEDGEIYLQSFRPSMLALPLQVFGKMTNALVTGWSSMAIVDLRDGYALAEHSLPCQPIQKPLTADFNNDGWTDVIVVCPSGFVGFSLHQQSGYLYTALMSTTVVLVVCLLSWCCTPEHELEDAEQYCDHYQVD